MRSFLAFAAVVALLLACSMSLAPTVEARRHHHTNRAPAPAPHAPVAAAAGASPTWQLCPQVRSDTH